MTATPTPAQPQPGEDTAIGVIGLGYVGLPLAVAFGARFQTRGFDTDSRRIEELQRGYDATHEVAADELGAARQLSFGDVSEQLVGSDVLIVTVPTPIDDAKQPDLTALKAASRTVGDVIRPGGIVVFESTVYPGATEEVCIPIIERTSGLVFNEGFFVGYSPERINPGDRQHRLGDVVKVTAGSTPETLAFVDALYARIVPAGTHRAPDIRTAEAAKVIENTQRDLNIALVNELAMIFERLGLDTEAVLDAAGTKWNFLPFQPGLVGGHCIGVDPYYLTHKAQATGFSPDLVLAGRRVNDRMPEYIAEQVAQTMAGAGIAMPGARLLVLGLAFKENCPDVRNTKVVDLVDALRAHGARVDIHDPWVAADALDGSITLTPTPAPGSYDAVVVAVAHDVFRALGAARIRAFGKARSIVYDVKRMLPASAVDARL